MNGVTCQPNGNVFVCICSQYYTGTTCSTCNLELFINKLYMKINTWKLFLLDSNACSLNPCLNNGVCQAGNGNNYICNCLSGYSGTNCQISNLFKIHLNLAS